MFSTFYPFLYLSQPPKYPWGTVWSLTALLATFLMLNWAMARASVPSVWIGPLLGLPLLSLILAPMLSFGVLQCPHIRWTLPAGASPWLPMPVPVTRLCQQCHSCARAGRSGTLGQAVPGSLLGCFLFCLGVWGLGFFGGGFLSLFWLQTVPYHLPTGHMSFSPCCWAEIAHLQSFPHPNLSLPTQNQQYLQG